MLSLTLLCHLQWLMRSWSLYYAHTCAVDDATCDYKVGGVKKPITAKDPPWLVLGTETVQDVIVCIFALFT